MPFPKIPPSRSRSQRHFGSYLQRTAILVLTCELLAITVGCGSMGSSPSTLASSQVQVAVSPRTAVLSPATQQRFTATVQGTSNTAVTWISSAGSISVDGTFVAPVVSDGTQVTITAKSVTNSAQAESVVTIQRPANRPPG